MRVLAKDRIGTIVNGFKILDWKQENKRSYFLVVCPFCKENTWMRADMLTQNTSCGCYNKKYNYKKPTNIQGRTFDRLKAISPTVNRSEHNGSIMWECECSCGNIVFVSESDLSHGRVRSCGCFGHETSITNGKKVCAHMKENKIFEGTHIGMLHSKTPTTNKTGVKGVCYDNKRRKFVAQITFKGKNYNLGRYGTLEQARQAREDAEKELFLPILEKYKDKL